MRVTIVNPTGRKTASARELAPRYPSLEGAVVGLLDNNKPGAGELFDGLEGRLREMGVADVIRRKKAHPSAPSPFITDVAERADLAVSALGD